MNEPIPQEIPIQNETAPTAKKKIPYIIGIVILVSIIIFSIMISRINSGNDEIIITPTPSIAPEVSEIASASAFMIWNQEVASLSGLLEGYNLQDSTLATPQLEVDLEL